MRDVVIHAPKHLRLDTVPDAPEPGHGQVRVRLGAGGICGSDLQYSLHAGFCASVATR